MHPVAAQGGPPSVVELVRGKEALLITHVGQTALVEVGQTLDEG